MNLQCHIFRKELSQSIFIWLKLKYKDVIMVWEGCFFLVSEKQEVPHTRLKKDKFINRGKVGLLLYSKVTMMFSQKNVSFKVSAYLETSNLCELLPATNEITLSSVFQVHCPDSILKAAQHDKSTYRN